MIQINDRKRYLDQLIRGDIQNHRPLKGCTLVGKPKKDVIVSVRAGTYEWMEWMKQHQIPFERKKYESVTVNVYLPREKHQEGTDYCYIKIENPTIEQIDGIIKHGFEVLWDVYEVEVPNLMIERWLENDLGNIPFTVENIFDLLSDYKQSELANLISRSPQAICDFKKGRMTPTLEVIKALMREFPLLPWQTMLMILE